MAVEIEIKARVDDPEHIKERIPQGAVYLGSRRKADQYWFPPPEYSLAAHFPSGIRVRREQKSRKEALTCVCFKIKELRDTVEVNDEREFEVSDAEIFTQFLERLAFVRGQAKTKTGWAWEYQGITIELLLVAGLGWFVELEILSRDSGEDSVAAARKRLLELLAALGISGDKIEPRYYTEMLQE